MMPGRLITTYRNLSRSGPRAVHRAGAIFACAILINAGGWSLAGEYRLDRISGTIDEPVGVVEFSAQLFVSAGINSPNGARAEWSLQRVDGLSATSLGTFNANDVWPPSQFATFNGELFFTAQAGSLFRRGLYRTDGQSVELLSSDSFG